MANGDVLVYTHGLPLRREKPEHRFAQFAIVGFVGLAGIAAWLGQPMLCDLCIAEVYFISNRIAKVQSVVVEGIDEEVGETATTKNAVPEEAKVEHAPVYQDVQVLEKEKSDWENECSISGDRKPEKKFGVDSADKEENRFADSDGESHVFEKATEHVPPSTTAPEGDDEKTSDSETETCQSVPISWPKRMDGWRDSLRRRSLAGSERSEPLEVTISNIESKRNSLASDLPSPGTPLRSSVPSTLLTPPSSPELEPMPLLARDEELFGNETETSKLPGDTDTNALNTTYTNHITTATTSLNQQEPELSITPGEAFVREPVMDSEPTNTLTTYLSEGRRESITSDEALSEVAEEWVKVVKSDLEAVGELEWDDLFTFDEEVDSSPREIETLTPTLIQPSGLSVIAEETSTQVASPFHCPDLIVVTAEDDFVEVLYAASPLRAKEELKAGSEKSTIEVPEQLIPLPTETQDEYKIVFAHPFQHPAEPMDDTFDFHPSMENSKLADIEEESVSHGTPNLEPVDVLDEAKPDLQLLNKGTSQDIDEVPLLQVLTEKATPVLSSTPTISTTELESPYIEEPEEIVKSKSSDSLELKDSEDAFATVDFDEQATITIAPLSSFKSNSGNTSPKPSKKVHFLIEESPNNGGSDVTEADDDLEAGDDLEDRERETQFNHESFLRISEWNESATSLVPVPTMSLVPVPTEPIVENPVPVAQEADKDVFVINIPQAAVEAGDRETFSDFSDLTAARPGVEYPLPIVEETRPITPEAEDAIIDIAAEDWIKAEPADIEPRVGPRISVDEEEGLTSTTVGLPRRRWSIFRSFRSSIRAFKSPQRGQIDGPSATATRAASSTRDNAETLPRHSESIKSTRSTRSPLLRRISTKPLVNGIAHKAKQTRDAVFSAGAARKVWGFVKFLTGYGNPSTDAKTSGRGLHTIKARNHRSWVQDIADLEEGKAIVESKPTNTNQKTARHHRRVDSGVGFCEGEFAGDELSVQSLNEVVRLAVATATSKKTSPFSSSISFPAPAAVAAVRA